MNNLTKILIGLTLCFAFTVMLSSDSYSQEKAETKVSKEDLAKVMEEISGDWEIDAMGEIMVVNFYVEDETLYALPEMESEAADMSPVEGELLEWEINMPDGGVYGAVFSRDEEGKIKTVIIDVTDQGIELEGVKIDG